MGTGQQSSITCTDGSVNDLQFCREISLYALRPLQAVRRSVVLVVGNMRTNLTNGLHSGPGPRPLVLCGPSGSGKSTLMKERRGERRISGQEAGGCSCGDGLRGDGGQL